ncbi:hypothetical protein [Flavobacterium sp. CS20]|uniref:hypothetical protein n=1 Tax=Flavobacterium sp. CS20 TaxID=2775246 RepID=UPI001B3A47AB|nr:hypothetical protein [Flavobacterium sp. CS20]QTY28209.1 hypothetical protein IGB25_06975 [Flavobacterium sp. CS20]
MKTIINNSVKTALFLLMSVIVITFSACSAEDGMDGVQVPQGEQGPAGQDGEDGNANVIASDWFPVEFDQMSTSTPPTWGRMVLGNEDIPEVDLSEYMEGTGGVMLIYLKTLVTLSGGSDTGYLCTSAPFYIFNLGSRF